jgi:hypothetical protein
MPAIHKIRITGLRYNNQQKVYSDKIFDLGADQSALHTLITLINSGGKGVLLQSIFQIVLPLTSWGKNNNNMVRHFFYQNGVFRPYTFYVGIEWRLDTEEEKYLITGIGITAKKSSKENEDIDVDYQLFVRECQANDTYRLELLPYYDRTNHKVLELDKWRAFLEEYSFFFQKFNDYHYSKSKYYQLLESYGIYRDDWSEMVKMNKDEAGIKQYFEDKSTTTNRGLFQELMIPAIDARLKSVVETTKQQDLATLFKDNAIIAKQLPFLLKREGAFKEMISLTEDFSSVIDEALENKQKMKDHYQYGRDILYVIADELQNQEQKQGDLKIQLTDYDTKEKDLLFQKDNVEYARQAREIGEGQEKVDQLMKDQGQAYTTYEKTKEIAHMAKSRRLLKHFDNHSQLVLDTQREINIIEESKEMKESKATVDELRLKAESQWEDVSDKLKKTVEDYVFYQNFLQANDKEKRESETQLDRQLRSKLARADSLQTQIDEFSKEISRYEEKYGPILFNDPAEIKTEKQAQGLKLSVKQEALGRQIQTLNEQTQNNKQLLGSKEKEVESVQKEEERLQKLFMHYEKLEQDLTKRMYLLLKQPMETVKPSFLWINDQKESLKVTIVKLESKLLELQQKYWSLRFEIQHSDQDFWIANDTMVKAKEIIEQKGIEVVYGSQYLFEIVQEQREKVLQEHPILPYGLCVYERDMKKILSIEDFSSAILHSPVPIYSVETLQDNQVQAFLLLTNQADRLSLDSNMWRKRKQVVNEESYEYSQQIKTLGETVEKARELHFRVVEYTTGNENTLSVDQEIQSQQFRKEEIVDDIKGLKNTLREQNQKIKNSTEESQQIGEKLNGLQKEIDSIERFEIDLKEDLNKQEKFKIEQKEIDNLDQQLLGVRKESERIKETLNQLNLSYREWKFQEEKYMEDMKKLIPLFEFPSFRTDDAKEMKPIFQSVVKSISPVFIAWDTLQKKLDEKNVVLVQLKERLVHFSRNAQEALNELQTHEPNWGELNVPQEDFNELKQYEERAFNDNNGKEMSCQSINQQLGLEQDRQQNRKQQQQKTSKKIHIDHDRPPEDWSDENLDKKEALIFKELDNTSKTIGDIRQQLSTIQKKFDQMQTQHKILTTHVPEVRGYSDISNDVKEGIQQDVDASVYNWIQTNAGWLDRQKKLNKQLSKKHQEQKEQIERTQWDEILKKDVLIAYQQMELYEYDVTQEMIDQINRYAKMELEKQKQEKDRAEQAKNDWAIQASKLAVQVIDAIQRMVDQMKVKNKGGWNFPLIQIKNKSDMPKTIDQILPSIQDFFERTLKTIFAKYDDIEELKLKVIEEKVNTGNIVLAALDYRFPTLQVYNLNTDNTFVFERPKASYYKDWETMNQGSLTDSTGSGGQLVASRTLVAMMLLSYKRQVEVERRWMVFISDNPFAQAVSPHIVDPIFEAANLLKFQWIVVSPPEIIKIGISEKFPTWYHLELKKQTNGKDLIEENVTYGMRQYQ